MNQNVCPKCERALDFWTDGNGKLIAIHPVTPCIPRVHAITELHVIGECPVCEDAIYATIKDGRPRQTCGKKSCGVEYRNRKQQRLREQWREANRRRYEKGTVKPLTESQKEARRVAERKRYHEHRRAA